MGVTVIGRYQLVPFFAVVAQPHMVLFTWFILDIHK
jgi:hypothetical protein